MLYEEIAEGARENAGVFDARGLVGISFTRQQRFCGDWRPTHVLADGNGPLAPYVWDVVPVATTFAVGVDFALHELLRRCKHDLVGVQANVYDVVSGECAANCSALDVDSLTCFLKILTHFVVCNPNALRILSVCI